MISIRPLKRCPKCGETKPATSEFFGLDRSNIDLCTSRCRSCRLPAPSRRAWPEPPDPSKGRVCICCRKEKPEPLFPGDRVFTCRECANARARSRRGPSRPCALCGKAFCPSGTSVAWATRRFCSPACATRARPRKDPALRFWARVSKTETCWLWVGGKNRLGYGSIMVGRKNVRTNRFSYELHFGSIPDGMLVCHHCDNPQCVRPDHLFLGTSLDNSNDMIAKGRARVGTEHYAAVLTEEMVRELRECYDGGGSVAALAKRMGVHCGTALKACRRESWKHVA